MPWGPSYNGNGTRGTSLCGETALRTVSTRPAWGRIYGSGDMTPWIMSRPKESVVERSSRTWEVDPCKSTFEPRARKSRFPRPKG